MIARGSFRPIGRSRITIVASRPEWRLCSRSPQTSRIGCSAFMPPSLRCSKPSFGASDTSGRRHRCVRLSTPQGDCRLKPIVEINPRYTMGRLTVELMKQASPGSCGLFRLVSRAMARAEGFDDFVSYARSLSERFPIRLEGEPVARISEGALCLNDPAQAQACLAIFQVSRTLNPLLGTVACGDPSPE